VGKLLLRKKSSPASRRAVARLWTSPQFADVVAAVRILVRSGIAVFQPQIGFDVDEGVVELAVALDVREDAFCAAVLGFHRGVALCSRRLERRQFDVSDARDHHVGCVALGLGVDVAAPGPRDVAQQLAVLAVAFAELAIQVHERPLATVAIAEFSDGACEPLC